MQKLNDSTFNVTTALINLYKELKDYLLSHSPICKMLMTKTMIPMQEMLFLDKHNIYGKVSAKNIVSWSITKNKDVEVVTTLKRFTIPMIPLNNTKITDWNEFIEILLGQKVVIDDFEDRREHDFEMVYCSDDLLSCTYRITDIEAHEVTEDTFDRAEFHNNVICVYTTEHDQIGLLDCFYIPVEYSDDTE